MDPLKMYSLLKMGIFHCYVHLPEGRCFVAWIDGKIAVSNGLPTLVSEFIFEIPEGIHCSIRTWPCLKKYRFHEKLLWKTAHFGGVELTDGGNVIGLSMLLDVIFQFMMLGENSILRIWFAYHPQTENPS